MLTGNLEEKQDESTDETPTFGVVNDGRTYPAVTARRRQQNGSRRSTLYTVSKNGANKALYEAFEREVIQPYLERRRERENRRQHPDSDSANTYQGGVGTKETSLGKREHGFGFPVNTVDG